MIAETTSDLQDHLLDLDSRVQSLQWKGSLQSAPNELEEIREERASTEQCLNICAEVSEAIEALKNTSHWAQTHTLLLDLIRRALYMQESSPRPCSQSSKSSYYPAKRL